MLYLYGLIEPDERGNCIPDQIPVGVTGAVQIQEVTEGLLVFGADADDDILPKRRNLLAHTRVLEAFNPGNTLLPMRFGMTSPSMERVTDVLAAQRAEVAAAFDAIRGAVELGLRVSFPKDAALSQTLVDHPDLAAERARLAAFSKPPHFETAEFGRRLGEALDRRRQQAQKAVVSALSDRLRRYVLRAPEDDAQVLALDVLVETDQQDRLAAELSKAVEGLRFAPSAEPWIRVVGPIPPYSFVQLNLGEADRDAA